MGPNVGMNVAKPNRNKVVRLLLAHLTRGLGEVEAFGCTTGTGVDAALHWEKGCVHGKGMKKDK